MESIKKSLLQFQEREAPGEKGDFGGSMNYTVISLGCSRRDLDGERICSFFDRNGYTFTTDYSRARYLVVVTCGLTAEVTRNCQEVIRKYDQYPGQLVVYGCLPAMDPDSIQGIPKDKILFTKNLEHLDRHISLREKFVHTPDANSISSRVKPSVAEATANPSGLIPKGPISGRQWLSSLWKKLFNVIRYPHAHIPYQALLLRLTHKAPVEGIRGGIGFNNKYFTIRVSEGCLGQCSYCTIRYAIGKLKSKPLKEIAGEMEKAAAARHQKINIVSSDTGAYGLDTGSSLPEMLQQVLDSAPRVKIAFIQDLHPHWIIRYREELIRLVATGRIKSLLTAVQSGSERVLTQMRRQGDLNEFYSALKALKKACPALGIRTQVIVGFPGETEEDFQQTVDMVKRFPFDEVDIFGYYEVKGAHAQSIYPKVPVQTIRHRAETLRAMLSVPCRVSLSG